MSKLLAKCGLLLLLVVVLSWFSQARGARPTTVFGRKSAAATARNHSDTSGDEDAGSNDTATTAQRKLALEAPPALINESEYEDDQYEEIIGTRSDEYVYDLLESLTLSVQEKLRRSEGAELSCRTLLERAVKRLDTMDDKLEQQGSRMDAAVHKLRAMDARLARLGGTGSGAAGSLDAGLGALAAKVDALATKINELKDDVVRDKRGTGVAAVAQVMNHAHAHDGDPLAAQSSERRDFIKDKSGRNIQLMQQPEATAAEEKVNKDIEAVKDTLTSLDSRIQYWMQQVSTTANGIAQSIGDLHDAIMEPPSSGHRVSHNATDEDDLDSASSGQSPSSARYPDGRRASLPADEEEEVFLAKETKLDKLFRKIHPLLRATEKMDDMWNVVLGTQRLVDDSLHKSDQLLTNSYRQVQSLTDVKTYLAHQTGKIMHNLEQVEEWMKEQGTSGSGGGSADPEVIAKGINDILNKTAHLRRLQDAAAAIDFNKLSNNRSAGNGSTGSGEEEPQPEAEAYHHDTTEYLKDGRKAVEAKSVSVGYARNATAGNGSHQNNINKRKPLPTTTTTAAPLAAKRNGSSPVGGGNEHENLCPLQGPQGTNCADLRGRGVVQSGIYYILIKGTTYWFMKVYCDMETDGGGWTVIQRRDNFGHPRENFIRDWNDYKNGFGDMKREFWLGNENVFMLTNQEDYSLRVDLEDFDKNKRYAVYTKFKIDSEAENYKLEIGGYEGNAADSLNDPWYGSNLSPFSTYDRDNDRSSLNCASMLRGGWWWRSCGRGLNGIYLTNPTDLAARQGIVWFRWRGWDYTMKKASMSIRPKAFVPAAAAPERSG